MQKNSEIVEKEEIVKDETLFKIYEEILEDIRTDRSEVSDLMDNFTNLVMNEGDATTSSKEALVNLMKIKTDLADKKSKIADLYTRLKLKERNTFPPYLSNNVIKINTGKKKQLDILKLVAEEKNGA